MRLLFVRHGDPDYEHDTLTEKGEREAELLADRLQTEKMDYFYLSPQGRAQKTGQAVMRRLGRTGETFDWLHEFTPSVTLPESGQPHIIWDFMPSFMQKYPQLYSPTEWLELPFIRESTVPQGYRAVCEGIDGLLARHGYVRKDNYYSVKKSNRDTLVFFCHFGATAVVLSHLFNQSPVALMQHFSAPTTSVTTVYTEEREEGITSFRCMTYGDVSHLYAAKEPVSFSGRFCETFDDPTERH